MRFYLTFLFFCILYSKVTGSNGTIFNLNINVSVNPENKIINGQATFIYNPSEKNTTKFCFKLNKPTDYKAFINKQATDSSVQNQSNICLFKKFKASKSYSLLIKYTLDLPDSGATIYLNNASEHWIPTFQHPQKINDLKTTLFLKKGINAVTGGVLQQIIPLSPERVRWRFHDKDVNTKDIFLLIGNFKTSNRISKKGTTITFIYNDSLSSKIFNLSENTLNFLEKELGQFPFKSYFQSTIQTRSLKNAYDNDLLLMPSELLDLNNPPEDSYIDTYAFKSALRWFRNFPPSLAESFATYYKWKIQSNFYGLSFLELKLNLFKKDLFNGTNKTIQNAFILSMVQSEVGDVAFKEAINSFLLNPGSAPSIESFKYYFALDSTYLKPWLNGAFPFKIAFSKIDSTETALDYKTIKELSEQPLELKYNTFKKAMSGLSPYFTKKEIVDQLGRDTISKVIDIIQTGLNCNDFYLNNLIIDHYETIPPQIKPKIDSLFSKHPYYLSESRLINLCTSFPKECDRYTHHYSNHSISFLKSEHIKLAKLFSIILHSQDTKLRSKALKTLNKYTEHPSLDIRKKVFPLLEKKALLLDSAIQILIEGTCHNNKSYAEFCKAFIEKIKRVPYYKIRIKKIIKSDQKTL